MGVGVSVGPGVSVSVGVAVSVGVGGGMSVGVAVGVLVGAGVSVGVGVGVDVLVSVAVGVGVFVGVAVGVGTGGRPRTMSCGPLAPDSRLARVNAVGLDVMSARLTGPLPVTSGVTSTVTHVPATSGPEEPTAVAENDGALAKVIVVSPQVLSETPCTLKPVVWLVFTKTRSVALVATPTPLTLKRV